MFGRFHGQTKERRGGGQRVSTEPGGCHRSLVYFRSPFLLLDGYLRCGVCDRWDHLSNCREIIDCHGLKVGDLMFQLRLFRDLKGDREREVRFLYIGFAFFLVVPLTRMMNHSVGKELLLA